MLFEMGCHPVNLAASILGSPTEVISRCFSDHGRHTLSLTLGVDGGRWAHITLDGSQPRVQERIEVSGTSDGRNTFVVIDNAQSMELHMDTHPGTDLDNDLSNIRPEMRLDGIQTWRPDYAIPNMQQSRHFIGGYAGEVRELIDAIVEQRSPVVTHADALQTLRLLEAVNASPNGQATFV